MVRFVIGEMDLQQLQMTINRLVESQLPDQKMHRPDSTGGSRPRAFGDLIVDVGGRHHRPVASPVVILVQPSGDSPLASLNLFSYLGVHSKTPPCFRFMGPDTAPYTLENAEGFRVFSCAQRKMPMGLHWFRG